MLRNWTPCKVNAVTTASHARPARGRRGTRPSGDDRELAILETAERLLEERPLADISVDDLAKGAGISRPTFYFYFPSKDAVLLTLLDRVIGEANTALEALMGESAEGAQRVLAGRDRRCSTRRFAPTARWLRPRRAGASTPTPRSATCGPLFMQRSIDHTTGVIEALRDRGELPDNMPAHELSTSLNLLNEAGDDRVFAGAEAGTGPTSSVLDNLVHIWMACRLQRGALVCRQPMRTYVRVRRGKPPSCTLTWIRSTHLLSSVTTPRCADGPSLSVAASCSPPAMRPRRTGCAPRWAAARPEGVVPARHRRSAADVGVLTGQ